MKKQVIISVLVLFVLTMVLGFLIHGVLLEDDYANLPNLMRSEEETRQLTHFMLLAHLVLAIGLTWIYRMGHEGEKNWVGQGLRFGLAVALVSTIPFFMIYYVVQQTPEALAVKQIGLETVGMLVVGMATAFLNR